MREMWNKSWNVNTTGTNILTHTIVPLLLKSSDPRLIFITSGTSTLAEHGGEKLAIDKSPGKGWPKQGFSIPAYRSVKTGMNMMREWARILKEDGVKVCCISPGFLATGLGGNTEMLKKMGALDPSIGASFIVMLLKGQEMEMSGRLSEEPTFNSGCSNASYEYEYHVILYMIYLNLCHILDRTINAPSLHSAMLSMTLRFSIRPQVGLNDVEHLRFHEQVSSPATTSWS
jgi:hypothetical protein